MANYAVDDFTTGPKSTVTAVLAALEIELETIDSTKTIHLIGITKTGTSGWEGYLITDT